MPNRALTVRQPYAAAIFGGGKDVENRSWYTNYRGPLWIHAGKGVESAANSAHTWDRIFKSPNAINLQKLSNIELLKNTMKMRGALIGVVDLVDCVQNSRSMWANREPGMYHWILKHPRRLAFAIACNGQQGLWVCSSHVAEQRLEIIGS